MRPRSFFVAALITLVIILSVVAVDKVKRGDARDSCATWQSDRGRPFRAGHLLECCVVERDGAVRCRP